MAKTARKPTFQSPEGIAVFPWLNTPDTKFAKEGEAGIYKTDLRLSAEEFTKDRPAEELGKAYPAGSIQEWIDGLVDASVAEAIEEHGVKPPHSDGSEPTKKERKVMAQPYYPYLDELNEDDEETGEILLRMKQNAEINRKDGTVIKVAIPLFDKYGKEITAAVYGG